MVTSNQREKMQGFTAMSMIQPEAFTSHCQPSEMQGNKLRVYAAQVFAFCHSSPNILMLSSGQILSQLYPRIKIALDFS